jgi:DNA polymerase-3 subunit delta'
MTTTERLSELVGLNHAKHLTQKLADGRSNTHAVLFYGPEGAGKSELADVLAQAWMCNAPTENGACGVCASCVSVARGTHPDLLIIEPQPPSQIIRLAAICGSEETVSIQQLFRTPPLSGRNKVAIVRQAERMNADAANAFLKTLEEPPPSSRVILTSASPGALLPTILSRCMASACELPETDELKAHFPAASDFEIQLSGGSPGRLRSILGTPGANAEMQALAADIQNLEPRNALLMTERFRIISEARDKATGLGARRAQAETLAELGATLRLLGAHSVLPNVVEAHRRILGNGNSTLVLDELFTSIACAKS